MKIIGGTEVMPFHALGSTIVSNLNDAVCLCILCVLEKKQNSLYRVPLTVEIWFSHYPLLLPRTDMPLNIPLEVVVLSHWCVYVTVENNITKYAISTFSTARG